MAHVPGPVCIQVVVAVGKDPALMLPAPSVSTAAEPELVCDSCICPVAGVRVSGVAMATVSITPSPAALGSVTVGGDPPPVPVLEKKVVPLVSFSNGVVWFTSAKSAEIATTPTVGAVTGIVIMIVLSSEGGDISAQISTRDLSSFVLTAPTLKMPADDPLSVMEVIVEVVDC